jgi:transcriptional regulator with PAS, ATPase and Fis domain
MPETVDNVPAMLRICALLQSARELYGARGTPTEHVFKEHVLALISDLVTADRSAIYLIESGDSTPEIVHEAVILKRPLFTPGEMAVLLFVRDEIAGAIYLCRAEPFSESDFGLITAVSQIASIAIENSFHLERLLSEVAQLKEELGIEDELRGGSHLMSELRNRITRVAQSDATVLITGESGTGKELVARAVHRNSHRAAKPFVAINCAALAEQLLESELFGHEKGSFTGAAAQKRGKLESAAGGTVFLDEIGEMPIQLQAKLLRVLQQRVVERVGGLQAIKLDFRLVAATNRNLEESVRQGRFRQDLFYRLNVIALQTPALRERPEDIMPLARHFAAHFAVKCGRQISGISPQAAALLRNFDWPGNVRELENAIERAVVMGSSEMILPEDLPEALSEPQGASENGGSAGSGGGSLQDTVNSAKRMAVQRAYDQAGYDHGEAARLLGVHPNYLYRLVKNLRLETEMKKAARSAVL